MFVVTVLFRATKTEIFSSKNELAVDRAHRNLCETTIFGSEIDVYDAIHSFLFDTIEFLCFKKPNGIL